MTDGRQRRRLTATVTDLDVDRQRALLVGVALPDIDPTWADRSLDGPREDMTALIETIMERIDPPKVEEGPFRMLVSNIDWNDYVGRIAVGRILSGEAHAGQRLKIIRKDGKRDTAKITKLFEYSGLQTADSHLAVAGRYRGDYRCH